MDSFLNILKRIEDGELDQHEGSYLVGKYLKELYIDSAMRNEERIKKMNLKKSTKKTLNVEKNITYKDYKNYNLNY